MNRILAAISISIFGLGAGAYQTQVFSSDRAAPPTSPPVAQVGSPPEGPFGAGNVPQVDVDVNVNVSNPPVIPGPPVPGEKLAPVPKDPTIKAGKLPLCPVEGAVTTRGLAGGCVKTDRVRLNGLLDDECETGKTIIEIGPSAPRPLGWGIVGAGFHWGMPNTYDHECHGTPLPTYYKCQIYNKQNYIVIDAGYPTRQECFDIAARASGYRAVVGTDPQPIPGAD